MISAFEYVTVLISIILGLGITQILTGIADLFHKSDRVKLYWPHVLWIIFVLILHVQEWWVTYELKKYQPWRLPVFLFIMLYPINLFVLARMLFPLSLEGDDIDLKSFYFANFRRIFLLTITSAMFSVAYNLTILALPLQTQIIQMLIISSFAIVAIKSYQQEWIHKAMAVLITLIMIASIIIEWDVWLVN